MEYILFCAGSDAVVVVRNLEREGKRVKYLVDNLNYDCDYTVDRNTYAVYYPTKLYEEDKDNITIIIASLDHYESISVQLTAMGFMEGKEYYSCFDYIQQRWEDEGKLVPSYEIRVKRMSELMSKDVSSVLDLGCGNMHLKSYLNKDITYIPCDYIKHDDATIVCDLNKDDFPNVETDVVFMSGILVYIFDYERFIKKVCSCAKKEIVCSYKTLECSRGDIIQRKRRGWVNNLTMKELVELFRKYGMKLTHSQRFCPFGTDQHSLGYMIMKFESLVQ